MKKLLLTTIILFISTVIAYSAENSAESGWKRVSDSSFIDEDGIMGAEDIYGFSFLLKSYNKGQYEPVNDKKISYTLAQYTIDCGKQTYKIGVIDSYDKQGNFVSGDYNRFAKFQPIVQGTSISNVYQKLCRP